MGSAVGNRDRAVRQSTACQQRVKTRSLKNITLRSLKASQV